MNYELKVEAKPSFVNRENGQFLKGHVPFNKGKKWQEWQTKEGRAKSAKGWKNLDIYRPKKRSDNAGRCGQKMVAVLDDGRWKVFKTISDASRFFGIQPRNITRCAMCNKAGVNPTRSWKRVNTDHKYKGMRWYYESDDLWIEKVKELGKKCI